MKQTYRVGSPLFFCQYLLRRLMSMADLRIRMSSQVSHRAPNFMQNDVLNLPIQNQEGYTLDIGCRLQSVSSMLGYTDTNQSILLRLGFLIEKENCLTREHIEISDTTFCLVYIEILGDLTNSFDHKPHLRSS